MTLARGHHVSMIDCIACPVKRIRSAHVPDGEWEHDEGVNPCIVDEDASFRTATLIQAQDGEREERHRARGYGERFSLRKER